MSVDTFADILWWYGVLVLLISTPMLYHCIKRKQREAGVFVGLIVIFILGTIPILSYVSNGACH